MDKVFVNATTGVMKPLLGKLTSLMGQEFVKLKGLRKEVKFIRDELSSMNDLLERLADVEELDQRTRGWRNLVREMAYDMEDIIDEFMQYDIGNQSGGNSSFIRRTIGRLKALRDKHRIAGQIEGIMKLVRETSERRIRYKLDECIPARSHVEIDRRIVALYENEVNLVGMEGPMNNLVNSLMDEAQLLKVVSIVGFGGLGKTTLANQLRNKHGAEFQCNAFISVSQKPDITKLLSGLISQLRIESSSYNYELHILLNTIREHLQYKRYFIIIDDIWDVKAWDVIKCAFPENHRGSRLIVTTRIQSVANACCSNGHHHVFNMKPLDDKDSRTLFFLRIFGSEEACPKEYKEFSAEILKKCGGLPLAIVSIASLLASEGNKMKIWEHIRNSLRSMTGENLNLQGIREILNLSYRNLPYHLKTCLLYLGMYPEDSTITKPNLLRRWIAEGFVVNSNGQDVWEVASRHFNELVNRSLVQPIYIDNDGSVRSCKVHDMMLDLILCKSREENFITAVYDKEDITGLLQKARRLSLCGVTIEEGHCSTILTGDISLLPTNLSLSQLRSLVIRQEVKYMPPLPEFKFLRVLEASIYSSDARDSIKIDLSGLCKLHFLRYLKIRGCKLCQLPTQIRELQHLETFDIDGDSFPSDIVYLPCLSYLKAGYGAKGLHDGIGNMKSLRYLWNFDICYNSTESVKGLGELTNLRFLNLTNRPYWNVEVVYRLLFSSLGKLCHLKHLTVEHVPRGQRLDGLSTLSPCLETLHLISCWFSRVPNWMSGLRNLRSLSMGARNLHENDALTTLAELPTLFNLTLYCRCYAKGMIVIYPSAFPALKTFSFHCGSSYSHITFQVGAMPSLRKLYMDFNLHGWTKDQALPMGIEHLLALELISAEVQCIGFPQSDTEEAEATIRRAASSLPSHPRITISWDDYDYAYWGRDDCYLYF